MATPGEDAKPRADRAPSAPDSVSLFGVLIGAATGRRPPVVALRL